jgi:hypothetical protein
MMPYDVFFNAAMVGVLIGILFGTVLTIWAEERRRDRRD